MTAALERHDDDVAHEDEEQAYPSRVAIRLNDASYHLYDALTDATDQDGITYSHRVLALVSLWQDGDDSDPALREKLRDLVVERAAEIAQATRAAGSARKAESLRKFRARKKNAIARRAREHGDEERAVS